MSKSKPSAPQMENPSSRSLRIAWSLASSEFEQIRVFAAQIDEAFSRADDETGDRHPLEDALGERGKQNAILERSGLAFVGVADDEAVGAGAHCGRSPI